MFVFNLFASISVRIFMSVFSNAIGRKDEGSVSSLPSLSNSEILASYNVQESLQIPKECENILKGGTPPS